MTTPNFVSGSTSTLAELEKDADWLQVWLKDRPSRLGLGDLTSSDPDPERDEHGSPAFVASDEAGRCFSVGVRLGELEASHGFSLLDDWARNRSQHPDKTHVAVLVTESAGDRYRTTLEALAEHLPLVVVELQVWRGEEEAIVVPHIALSSHDLDLGSTPAARSAGAVARAAAAASRPTEPETIPDAASTDASAEVSSDSDPDGPSADARALEDEPPVDKDDTGIADPWGPSDSARSGSGNGPRLLTKVGR